VLLVLALAAFVVATWLLTKDVYSDSNVKFTGGSNPTKQAHCGAPYDVIWLEGDGFMGGEWADNQPILNRECVKKAGLRVSVAMGLTGAGVVLLGAAIYQRTTDRRRRDEVSLP
jgi:hypothetical protein